MIKDIVVMDILLAGVLAVWHGGGRCPLRRRAFEIPGSGLCHQVPWPHSWCCSWNNIFRTNTNYKRIYYLGIDMVDKHYGNGKNTVIT